MPQSEGGYKLFKIGDLFDVDNTWIYGKNKQYTNRFPKSDDGYIPVISGITINNGVNYYTNDQISPDEIFTDSLTISTRGEYSGTVTYHDGSFCLANNILVMATPPKWSRNAKLYLGTLISKLGYGGYSGYPRKETLKNDYISLPINDNGDINFSYMEKFIYEMKMEHLHEIEISRSTRIKAYLQVIGLNDYELTDRDKEILNRLSTIQWRPFPITDVFTVRNTHNILASNVKLNSGTIPYLCASAENNGVGGYISYNQELIEPGNCVFIGGKTFVVSYQKEDFFSNDSHNIALYIKDYTPTRNNLLTLATCVKKSLGHKYTWGDSVSKAKIIRDTIMLPTIDGEHPDFAIMEQIIAAVQKIVIADVAKYTARNLEATQQVIESQEEPTVEPTITPLRIHDTYQPGRIPLYTLRAACGYFDDGQLPEEEGWIDATGQGFTPDKDRYFAVHAKGDSMLPKIHDGDICVFEWYRAGSRNGEIVLTQSSEYDDAYGGRYTIKRYYSEKAVTDEGWQHAKVELQPLNPDFTPIEFDDEGNYRTIGIFKCTLG